MGLILSGGGARGAYQAGVVKAIAEIASELGVAKPIPIITGVSAGAVNAAYLAATAENFQKGCDELAVMWTKLTAEKVFKTDAITASRSGLRLLADATVGALYRKKLSRSLLDTSPLRAFLSEMVPFDRIATNLRDRHIDALAVTAMNYSSSTSITFVEGPETLPMWQRSRRLSVREPIRVDHVMASAAIPLFFPPIKVGEEHFGDGCLRNAAPLSPAIHLGADRLLVISVRRPDDRAGPPREVEPSLARVLGVILNALLLDAVETDMERMSRINTTVGLVPDPLRTELSLRKLDFLWIRPSRDIGNLAGELFDQLPKVIRYLVSGLGSSREASELTSYLLFAPDFCGQLVRMGYEDGWANAEALRAFLHPSS